MVILDDGLPCDVRQLGMYELDLNVEAALPDRTFFYDMGILGGQVYKAPYVFPDEPPAQPATPLEEAQPGTGEWFAWQNYQTHEAAIAHFHTWIIAFEEWTNRRLDYILMNCISPVDRLRIMSRDDWRKIENAALYPELGMEDLERQAHLIFQGHLGWCTHSDYLIRLLRGWLWQRGGGQEMGTGNDSNARVVGSEMAQATA